MKLLRLCFALQSQMANQILVAGLIMLVFYVAVDAKSDSESVSLCNSLAPSPVLEKFVDALPIPSSIDLAKSPFLTLGAYKIKQKLHRDLPATTLYGYGRSKSSATYPGPSLVATRKKAAKIRWENHITDDYHLLTVDRTLNYANPKKGGVPMVVHLHGGEVPSYSDGHPQAWITAKGEKGPTWKTQNYTYPNAQFPTMLWYHDHTIGMTRLNVYAGLAGLYFINSPQEKHTSLNLPSGKYHIPLVFQDRQFYPNGSLNFPNTGINSLHPNWCPEFFGDTILVNGKVWPFLKVEARQYRFRILNGANARFFNMSLNSSALYFLKIGTDGGCLDAPIKQTVLMVAPGERVDIIVDFSVISPGTDIILHNSAAAPYPSGDDPTLDTAVVMKFHVISPVGHVSNKPVSLPRVFGPGMHPYNISLTVMVRNHTIVENDDDTGNVINGLLNNLTMSDPVTEKPVKGSTEIWQIINLTEDAHPIHLHLVRFRMLNRQPFDVDGYQNKSCTLDSNYPHPSSCYQDVAIRPDDDQIGWKDTVVVYPNYVTRFIISFTAQNSLEFPFDVTAAPGYVWHCHILDHEDSEMMRPLQLQPIK